MILECQEIRNEVIWALFERDLPYKMYELRILEVIILMWLLLMEYVSMRPYEDHD